MSRKYKIRDQNYPHFISFSVVQWIDLFTRDIYRQTVIDSLKYCQKEKGLIVYAWCIMTNHVHLIIGTKDKPMQDILRDMKSYTSRKLREEIVNNYRESRKKWIMWMMEAAGKANNNNNDWQLWQQHNHPIELSRHEMVSVRLNYLHNNPVKAGFVEKPEYWLYSSAGDYAGRKGMIDVTLID